jgi:hypothetical protein
MGTMQAQCLSFAKKVCKEELKPFIHDGNFNATVLGAGETAELYKTFFKGHKYRIAICKVKNLPNIHFRLIDERNHVLFDNKFYNYTHTWDFTVQTTQMLIVQLKVLDDYKTTEASKITKGCVSVLFGIDKKDN